MIRYLIVSYLACIEKRERERREREKERKQEQDCVVDEVRMRESELRV